MGFFSWTTADTGESIMNRHSRNGARAVYLLQPGGKPAIREDAYDGYGSFGGISAYNWVAENNLDQSVLDGLDEDGRYSAGVSLSLGSYYEYVPDGSRHIVFHQSTAALDPTMTFHNVTYAEPLEPYGMSANELIEKGLFVERSFTIRHPLKFSFNRDARYEDLPSSGNCPRQGFFEDDDDDD